MAREDDPGGVGSPGGAGAPGGAPPAGGQEAGGGTAAVDSGGQGLPGLQDAGSGGEVGGQEPGAGAGGVPSLPPEVARYGVRSYDELGQRLTAGQRAEVERDAYRELMESMQTAGAAGREQAARGGEAGGRAAPAAPENNWYGFGSAEAFTEALQRDYPGTMQRVVAQGVEATLRERGREMLEPYVAPLRQAQLRQHADASVAAVEAKYPHAKDPAVGGQGSAVDRFIQQHGRWMGQLLEAYPQVAVHEIAFKAGDYDRLLAEVTALKARLGERRQAAGVSRPGVAAPSVPAQGSGPAAQLARIKASLAAAGKPLDPRWEAAFRRHHGLE